MPPQLTRADSLREYFTGGTSDGSVQTNPQLSFGSFRSATEAASLGMVISTPIPNCTLVYAGGANPVGIGTLRAVDSAHLTWQPAGAALAGPPTGFTGLGDTNIVEADGAPGAYLRITAPGSFTPGTSGITLSYLADNVFSMDDVSVASAVTGISEYRATMVRNESASLVTAFQRWIATLATQQVSNVAQLTGSGAGTITTSGSFLDWPSTGWCRIETAGGTLKEVVYYSAKTIDSLTVPAAGRARLGTSAAAGTNTDKVYSVPGIAIAIDPFGVQASGTSIQLIAGSTTAPAGVTWNIGITAATGLQIGNLGVSQQVGLWMWREIPPGAISTPSVLNKTLDSFQAF